MIVQLVRKVAGGLVRLDRQRVVMVVRIVTRYGDVYERVRTRSSLSRPRSFLCTHYRQASTKRSVTVTDLLLMSVVPQECKAQNTYKQTEANALPPFPELRTTGSEI